MSRRLDNFDAGLARAFASRHERTARELGRARTTLGTAEIAEDNPVVQPFASALLRIITDFHAR